MVNKQNALFNKKLNFLINFRSVQINLHKSVIVFLSPLYTLCPIVHMQPNWVLSNSAKQLLAQQSM